MAFKDLRREAGRQLNRQRNGDCGRNGGVCPSAGEMGRGRFSFRRSSVTLLHERVSLSLLLRIVTCFGLED